MCGGVSFSTNYPNFGQLAVIGLSKLRSCFKYMQSVASYSSQPHTALQNFRKKNKGKIKPKDMVVVPLLHCSIYLQNRRILNQIKK
jgi:hypothetical protein